MKTAIVTGTGSVPGELRDLVEKGSTSLVEHRLDALADGAQLRLDADRIVFWTASPHAAITEMARRYARREAAERREVIVFVTADGVAAPALPPNECFVWPRDEDRLKMAFLTGA
jgi:hypothetical protein